MSEKIVLQCSEEFLEWWKKQICSNDQGLMFVAWSAWKACEERMKEIPSQDKQWDTEGPECDVVG